MRISLSVVPWHNYLKMACIKKNPKRTTGMSVKILEVNIYENSWQPQPVIQEQKCCSRCLVKRL
jgi:hypothetical protein